MRNPIAISSGHGLKVRGARGNPVPPEMDEVDEVRLIVDRVAEILRVEGVTVYKFHDNTSTTVSQNLNTIVAAHNAKQRQLDVSVHLNATEGAHGTEVLYVTQEALAREVSKAIAQAGGFTDRGSKYRTDLSFLNNTNEPAILIETWFCDSKSDCDKARAHYEDICQAIARSIAGLETGPSPGPEPEPEVAGRPVIGDGDYGHNVREVQTRVGATVDGDFGPGTTEAVATFQRAHGLPADGVVGSATWAALDTVHPLTPYPPPLPPKFHQDVIIHISQLAASSAIASYSWRDRGQLLPGYIKGMAVAYAQAVQRFYANDPTVMEMAQANSGNDEIDALSWYDSMFAASGMINDEAGLGVLRHLYVLLLGLGMRESSGRHCEGRDTSASNTSATTAEAGLMQTSYNASSCCTDFLNLCDQYDKSSVQGYMSVFAEGVTCNSSSWSSYGSGPGFEFQETCKWSPVFAVETCAIVLRRLRQHYGPINRREAEIRPEADALFKQIETYVATLPPWMPDIEPPPVEPPPSDIEALLEAKPDDPSSDPHIQWLTDSMEFILRQKE